ncbi:carboxypeptidase-like regulatory domain-containing protein [Robiginitalea sp. SC105]|uniref:carboxypeptidase-like regulatory domain-containing protein n=1 Tax=Robiginitalea sp. SC105 TaxID=2762332 RepID=UPI00163ADB35|nr:carboxypeptidase-like regulatory domain-containing protein [Robiginitalea sp. SC105]MBC2840151.1 carboxypeptidase-like regulatory domain-containing protein [Robiginitalea sp. SC105]
MKILRLPILLGICLSMALPLLSQEAQGDEAGFRQYRGQVLDAETNDPLVFATLTLDQYNISTVTNSEGGFLLKVPESVTDAMVEISFLGYKSRQVPLLQFSPEDNELLLEVSVTSLPEVDVVVPRDATTLVKETLRKVGDNYFNNPTKMTAFYRETIRKRRRNVSLSEAVVTIYKTPYMSPRQDAMELYKARKSTDYDKLDTVALKLQGGPFNALFVDIMKYPEYIFSEDYIDDYNFYFERNTRIDDRLIFVIGFEQKKDVAEPLYRGRLFIDGEKKVLTSAIFSLNITDQDMASRMFVRRKPANARVYPTEVAYRVDYREKDGRWYYGYSNALLEFKIDWDRKLFNSVFSLSCEMAVTDWELNEAGMPRNRERVKTSIILSDEALGFADPGFWGEYNIIEPDKSIESAIRKIQRQLRREDRNSPGKLP